MGTYHRNDPRKKFMETLFVENLILNFILLPLVLSSNLAMFEIRLLGYICGFTTVNHYRCKGSGPCINYTSHSLQQLTTGLLFLFSMISAHRYELYHCLCWQ